MPNQKYTLFIPFILILCLGCNESKPLTGTEVVDKSIAYHDPAGQWNSFKGELKINLEYPDGKVRESLIQMDHPQSIFSISEHKGEDHVFRYTDSDTSYVLVNDERVIENDSTRKKGLTNERTILLRDYYGYLYGLPMKLRDEGTVIHDEVEKVTFQGSEWYKVKVTYRDDVGEDTWYFYFDPLTYAMGIYQFYHEEEKNDGEYILLEGEIKFDSLIIPMDRTWYTNDSSRLLGVDRLVEVR